MNTRESCLLMVLLFAAVGCQELATEPDVDSPAFWRGFDDRIVWQQRNPETAGRSVMTMRSDGSDFRLLAANGISPRLSPDGSMVAFVRPANFFTFPWTGGIYYIGINDPPGSEVVLTTNLLDEDPAWSPDGQTVAFARGEEILAVAIAGGSPVLLFKHSGAGRLRDIDWSPDGAQLVYRVQGGGLWVVKLATGAAREIVGAQAEPEHPAWSPDGLWIAYSTREFRPALNQVRDIAKVTRSGRSLTRITAGVNSYREPAWSPDGSEIILSGTPGLGVSDWDLMRVPSAGGLEVPLPNNATNGEDAHPHWR